jgi:hypothetical protein
LILRFLGWIPILGWIPFLGWLLAFGVAYLIGEAVSLSVNRKRGPSLAVIAGAGVVVAYAVSRAVATGALRPGMVTQLPFDLWGLIILALAVIVAVGRVR